MGNANKTLVAEKLQLEIRKERPGTLQHGVSIRTVIIVRIARGRISERRSFGRIPMGTPGSSAAFAGLTRPGFISGTTIGRIRFADIGILNGEAIRRAIEFNKTGVLCGSRTLPKRRKRCVDDQGDCAERPRCRFPFKSRSTV